MRDESAALRHAGLLPPGHTAPAMALNMAKAQGQTRNVAVSIAEGFWNGISEDPIQTCPEHRSSNSSATAVGGCGRRASRKARAPLKGWKTLATARSCWMFHRSDCSVGAWPWTQCRGFQVLLAPATKHITPPAKRLQLVGCCGPSEGAWTRIHEPKRAWWTIGVK